jgi:hypothetical protein
MSRYRQFATCAVLAALAVFGLMLSGAPLAAR